MAVPLDAVSVRLSRGFAAAVRHSMREAVNVAALEITKEARRRTQVVLGPEQRMSRLTNRLRPDKGGRMVRVSLETIAKGGTRVNPYYRQADSVTKPVALVGARGPAHLIEHDRRGGYEVRPTRRTGLAADDAARAAAIQAAVFGVDAARTAARLSRPGAIMVGPDTFYGKVRPGAIRRPKGGPITKTFADGANITNRFAADTVQKSLDRATGRL